MYDKTELERVLLLQRSSFLQQGDANLQQRVSRTSRMALALLENIDVLSDTLCADYGWRHASVSKAFEGMSWVKDIEHTLAELAQGMAPRPVPGGFVQAKPKGVVGIMGAWNFPLTLTFQPAMAALAAGNRVMLNFPEQHPRTGALLREIFNARFDESEVTLFNGDLATATQFATLKLDHLFFTGSPEVGSLVSEAAAKNLVPVTLELGGKNPVVVARDADLALAATRIASTRLVNGGQVCLCPDYVFIPEEKFEEFVGHLQAQMRSVSGDYLHNPAMVPLVNERNYARVLALIGDATALGAQKLETLPESQLQHLPPPATTFIPQEIAGEELPSDGQLRLLAPLLTFPKRGLDSKPSEHCEQRSNSPTSCRKVLSSLLQRVALGAHPHGLLGRLEGGRSRWPRHKSRDAMASSIGEPSTPLRRWAARRWPRSRSGICRTTPTTRWATRAPTWSCSRSTRPAESTTTTRARTGEVTKITRTTACSSSSIPARHGAPATCCSIQRTTGTWT